jgi:catechol 2,3-dioxygenase-like lactoylglutathione lyase family enzyme
MLADFRLNPILPARDRQRAEAFYVEKLGLRRLSPAGADPMAFGAGDTMIVLTVIAGREPPDFPVVAFLVEGIDSLVPGLVERGVEFVTPKDSSFAGVEGEIAGFITDYGAVKSAFLRDSEGNILALNEIVATPP